MQAEMSTMVQLLEQLVRSDVPVNLTIVWDRLLQSRDLSILLANFVESHKKIQGIGFAYACNRLCHTFNAARLQTYFIDVHDC